MISYPAAELLLDAKAVLAEGPSYLPESDSVLWVDIEVGNIHQLDLKTLENRTIELGGKVGFVAASAKGDFIVGAREGLVRVDPNSGSSTTLATPESDLPDNRFNDGKPGPNGALWAGTMSIHETENAGSFYRLDTNGDVAKIFGDVTISNGLTWSPDRKTMYYIDTPTMRVDAFDFDLSDGLMTNRRTVIRIPDGIGYPDGMTVDAEGKLWIAMWAGWGVTRWDPDSGELIGKIPLPVEKVTACCFAGPNLDKLVITSASRDLSGVELEKQPLAGGLFVASPGVVGLPGFKFEG